MMLYHACHIPLILSGNKDVTRRLGKKRWNVGAFHQFKTNFKKNSVFAGAKILSVYEERLGQISDEHVLREGYHSRKEYFEIFARINDLPFANLDMVLWVVVFSVMGLMEVIHAGKRIALLDYADPTVDFYRQSKEYQLRAIWVDHTDIQPYRENLPS